MSSPRRRAWRALLSALAGGGLTAASLGPLSGGALGAGAHAATPTTTGHTLPPVTTSEAVATTPQTTTSTPSNTTSTPTKPTPSSTSTSTQETTAVPVPATPAPTAPVVVRQRRQKTTAGKNSTSNETASSAQPTSSQTAGGAKAPQVATGPNSVALPPQLIAAQAKALAAELNGSAASVRALGFYRIPLFLLPIYQAAAVQYGVPWQILAAINEIETDYGSNQSVSTAGAVGWMQFMPATWLQYGVDAMNAGYADPYNPIDAIFAAARYLRAAGAASNLRTAILAYNHSEEYADSVLLRAKLISSYPKPVIATLTGLIDGSLPVSGKQVVWGLLTPASSSSPSTATAKATAVSRATAATPAAAAAAGTGAKTPQFVELTSAPDAKVVAVQDGRIMQLGSSRNLGKYVILRDIYGDVFTYAGLGSIASSYGLPKATRPTASTTSTRAAVTSTRDPSPSLPASAGRQLPVTVQAQTPARQPAPAQSSAPASAVESASAGIGKVRVFAHPGNPDAVAAAKNAVGKAHSTALGAARKLPLRRGSVVAEGTVLGRVRAPLGAKSGHLRFAIRPAGDASTIDPQAILANWTQLQAALHPEGAKGEPILLGATARDAFLFSKSQLEREILSDPGVAMSACSRHEVASGKIDKRVLAVLAFLSRSGLKPTVEGLRCGGGAYAVTGYVSVDHIGDAVAISQINGIPIAGHQGSASITDTTIRTLLTLQGEFVPHQIASLMRYPGAPSTLARADHGAYIEIAFTPTLNEARSLAATTTKATTTTAALARAAAARRAAPSPLVASGGLTAAQWNQLIARIAALPVPTVVVKPSTAAIRDSKAP